METAKSKEQYLKAWKAHTQQLETLGYPLIGKNQDINYYPELKMMIKRINALIEIAADRKTFEE